MKSILLSLLLAAAWTLSAADLTGKWAGTVDMKQDGDSQTIPVVMIVKQEGNKLTGTAGPEEDQHAIQKGVVDGDTVTMEVDGGEAIFYLELKVDGDQISGAVKQGTDGEKMKIALKRVKQDT
ncbi:MAG TPA: hypothetical protein VGP62_30690 [Bryobacteraceae bacterium]|jgi:hypothetical protein|nr:hypothetical protein [Bryobacteraceae bacterium]